MDTAPRRTSPAASPGGSDDVGSWAGTTPQQRRADRRRRLLEAGRDAFGSQGYAGSAISRICKAARVTERDLYREFGGKEGLLIGVYDALITEAATAVADALQEPSDDPEARLRAAVTAFTDATTVDAATRRIHFVEVVGASPRIEAHRREVLRTFAGLLEDQWRDLHTRGALPHGPVPGLAMAAIGATQELLLDALSGSPHDPLEQDGPPVAAPDLDEVIDTITRVHLAIVRHA